jgi:hypothetical protein
VFTLSALNLACKAALLGAVVVSFDQEELKAVSSTFASVLAAIYCLESNLSSKTKECTLVVWRSAPIPPNGVAGFLMFLGMFTGIYTPLWG